MTSNNQIKISLAGLFDEKAGSCTFVEDLYLYNNNLLSKAQKDAFVKHSRTCNSCSKALIDLRALQSRPGAADLDGKNAEKIYLHNLARLKIAWDKEYPIKVAAEHTAAIEKPSRTRQLVIIGIAIGSFLCLSLSYLGNRALKLRARALDAQRKLNQEIDKNRELSEKLGANTEKIQQLENAHKNELIRMDQMLSAERKRNQALERGLGYIGRPGTNQYQFTLLPAMVPGADLKAKENAPKLYRLGSTSDKVINLASPVKPTQINLNFSRREPSVSLLVLGSSRQATGFLAEIVKQGQVLWSDQINLLGASAWQVYAIQLNESYFTTDGEFQLRLYERRADRVFIRGEFQLLVKKVRESVQ